MKNKTVFIIAGLLAILASIILFVVLYVPSRENRIAEKYIEVERSNIIAASENIPAGTVITEDMIKTINVPSNDPAVSDATTSPAQIIGMTAKIDILPDQTIFPAMLTSYVPDWAAPVNNKGGSLSFDVPEGMVAIAISTGYLDGVAGYLTRGDTVGILASSKAIKAASEGIIYYDLKDEKGVPQNVEYLAHNATLLAVGVYGQELENNISVIDEETAAEAEPEPTEEDAPEEAEAEKPDMPPTYEYVVVCVTPEQARMIAEIAGITAGNDVGGEHSKHAFTLVLEHRDSDDHPVEMPTGPNGIPQSFNYDPPATQAPQYTGTGNVVGGTPSTVPSGPIVPDLPGNSVIQ